MNIAIVCPYAWDRFGGVQTHVGSLATALRRRQHDVTVIAPSAGEANRMEPGVRIVGRSVPIPANGSVAPLAFGPIAAAGVRRALREVAPDVVHLHEPLIPSLSLLALWNTTAPAIGTFHAAAGSSVGYRVARPVLHRAARKLRIRTAVSKAAQGLAETYFPGDFVITPNGIDLERFESATALHMKDEPQSILFFSRLERRKGLDILIRAVSLLDDPAVELVIAGSGPLERAARNLVTQLGVSARFVGRVEDEHVPGLYRSATAYCAPGVGGESFGIVLLEAMASGVPVVCSDLPGYREVAAGAAELVRPGDPAALASALKNVLTDEAKRTRLAAASRTRAELYDWARLVRDVEHLYQAAVSRV